ncbi:MAG: DUF2156 domain-containing protein [Parachlamydia sp.]|nr:DUF2156 domain-containing protein [Parachlamydia sp.]
MNNTDVKELDSEKRKFLVRQVRRWGDLNSDAVLDSQCHLFSTPSIEGFIGYRIEDGCAIAFGDPVCALAEQDQLALDFQNYCKSLGVKPVFAMVSKNFPFTNRHGSLIEFGHKLVLDPSDDLLKKTGPDAVLIRKKVKHAQKTGVVIDEYLIEDLGLEKAIEQIGDSWLKARRGAQIYIAHHNFFNDREGKRWFYAKLDNRVIGFVILNEIRASWLLNNLITTQDAPSGTSELLIASVLKTLEMEKCTKVVIGPVVSRQIKHIEGLGVFSTLVVRSIFSLAKNIFRLDGQTKFWEKFHPNKEPSFVLFEELNFRTIKALLRAMNVKI